MRFITDLSKGILGGGDPPELWQQIVFHIPDELLLKPDVKILSVACGHGTEAALISRRMLSLGISKERVRDSIYVLDKYRQFTRYVTDTYGFTNVITGDFLQQDFGDMRFDLVVGNPPYGKNSNLAVKFLNKSATLSDNIWMVLPRTFRKPSIINRIDPSLHLQTDVQVADDAFPGSIITCYQHYVVGEVSRDRVGTVKTHPDFTFLGNKDRHLANVIVGRVGGGPCGKVFTDGYGDRSPNSHYYILARDPSVIQKLKSLATKFRAAGTQTVGCPSLSKNDLVNIYAEALNFP